MTLQPAQIIHPDAELWATTGIRTLLTGRAEPYSTGVYVSNTVPNPRRDRMVIVRRDGGTKRGVFDRPRLSLRIWALTEQDATDLARLVLGLLPGLANDGICTRVGEPSGPSPVADESGQPLRLSVVEATLRGTAL